MPVSVAYNDRASLASVYKTVATHLTQYGAVRGLSLGDGENLWFTNIKMTSSEHPIIEVNFQARIEESRGGIWDATIEIQREEKIITQNITLEPNCEFTLGGDSGPTLVRPILISFSEFLDEDDEKR